MHGSIHFIAFLIFGAGFVKYLVKGQIDPIGAGAIITRTENPAYYWAAVIMIFLVSLHFLYKFIIFFNKKN